MYKYDGSKFRFSETFNNSNGKTSGSGFIGVIMGLTSILAFISVIVGWWLNKPDVIEIFEKVLQLALLSAALLGVRKFTGSLMSSKGKSSVSSGNEPEQINS